MKLNCDVGEGFSTDSQVMPFIQQANIACGVHAGDVNLMSKTISIAKQNNVMIGAHPSYNDRENFGRLPMSLSTEQIKHLIISQVAELQYLAKQQQVEVEYVKPHGALYNQMMQEQSIFTAIVEAMSIIEQPLKLMILARPDLQSYQQTANKFGVELMLEAFADRAYDDQGYLVKRSQPNALLATAEQVEKQVKQLVETSTINTINGKVMTLQVDSICVHGDNQIAVQHIQKLATLFV